MFNPLSKNFKGAMIPDHTITKFFGNNTELSDIKTVPDGVSPDSLNWITGTEMDSISLRRGTALLGTTRQLGAGKITGLGVGTRYDGTQVVFYSHGRKVKYYDLAADDTIEVGSDLLPANADGDEVSIYPYQNLAGAFVYLSSINSSVYKIPVANPDNAVDQQYSVKGVVTMNIATPATISYTGHGLAINNVVRFITTGALPTGVAIDTDYYVISSGFTVDTFQISLTQGGAAINTSGSQSGVHSLVNVNRDFKGFLKFGQSRSILINRKGASGFKDNTNLYMSWVDAANLVSVLPFDFISAEAVGSLGSTHYTYTLKNVLKSKTACQVSVSADISTGREVFLDDRNGNLISNYGGTGTINYATGAVDVTFSVVTTGAVTVDYYTEDATKHGVLDYSFASTRVAGTGRFFSQFDGGGPLNAVFPLANVFYCFHTLKTWQTTIPTDDDDQGAVAGSNLPFREKMGVTYPYSVFGGATGIWYINNSNPNRPEVYQLQLFTGATSANIASPILISKALNLSPYAFAKAVMFEWGIYTLLCFQQIRNGLTDDFNSRTFLYNKKSGSWDLLDYPASRLAEYNGTLIAGDPVTNNIFTLFSGFDDDGSDIPNYWTSGATNHGVSGQKVHNQMVFDGLIQTAQNEDVFLSFDGGDWVKVFTISGTGSYVDTSKSIAVGSYVEGSKVVGGGATVYANPFRCEFTVNTPRYEYVRVKLQATGGGYIQNNAFTYKNIRYKGTHLMPIRTV